MSVMTIQKDVAEFVKKQGKPITYGSLNTGVNQRGAKLLDTTSELFINRPVLTAGAVTGGAALGMYGVYSMVR